MCTPGSREIAVVVNGYVFGSLEAFSHDVNFEHFELVVRLSPRVETLPRWMDLGLIQIIHDGGVPLEGVLQHFEDYFEGIPEFLMESIEVSPAMVLDFFEANGALLAMKFERVVSYLFQDGVVLCK